MSLDTIMLDEEQRAAAVDTEGYVAIIAGAGSGKTRVLASRVARLLGRGVDPADILCLTFTNKAADEMRGRIQRYSGSDTSGMQVGTYHSLCAGILRRYGDVIGIPPDFAIYEPTETAVILGRMLRERSISGLSSRQLQGEIDRFRAGLVPLDEWLRRLEHRHGGWYADSFRRGLTAYESAMRAENALDFPDLIRHTTRLLRSRPDILKEVSCRYILVDEYQDSCPVEAELVRLLSLRHGNLCVVGDPRQSIYGWRGSDYRLILNFTQTYPEARTHVLKVNYRSARKIVQASEIISRACTGVPDYQCRPFRSEDGRVTLRECVEPKEEASAVAESVSRLIGDTAPSDIAVLCRTHAQCQAVEAELGRRGMPYAHSSKPGFYDRPEVKLILDTLHSLIDPGAASHPLPPDALRDLQCLYQCGVSLVTLYDAASTQARTTLDARPTASQIATANLGALRVVAENHHGPALRTLPVFLASCRRECEPADAVSSMTVHAAKGMEFPVVLVVGLGAALSARQGASTSADLAGEETRLLYVAVTRAANSLEILA